MNIGQWIAVGLVATILLVAAVLWVFYRLFVIYDNHQFNSRVRYLHGEHWARMAESEAGIAALARVTHVYGTPDEYAWGRDAMDGRGYRLEHEPFTDGYGNIVADYVPKAPYLMEAQQA